MEALVGGRAGMEPDMSTDYGYDVWWLVILNSLIFIVFAFSFIRPRTKLDWRALGRTCSRNGLPALKSTRANTPPGSMCSARDAGRSPPPSPGAHLDGYPLGVYLRPLTGKRRPGPRPIRNEGPAAGGRPRSPSPDTSSPKDTPCLPHPSPNTTPTGSGQQQPAC